MDVALLSRIQFAITVGFHFLFPPISIGLSWLLVLVEWRALKCKDKDPQHAAAYDAAGRFFAKILGLTFAVGVATGIPMEFQFGTNWSAYSRFVGDIFGAPLAAEGVLAFFLESGFLGLYLFGRNRMSKRVHVLSILMVAIGSTLSAFWIIVADSWMQTPAGFAINNGRAELTSFFHAVFNPSTLPRFTHTVMAAIVAGAFFMAGISAYLVRRDATDRVGRATLTIAVIIGLISSILVAFPFGHEHAKQVARTQPEKFAAIEGLYSSQTGAPLVFFAIPFTKPPELKARVEVPGLLSMLAFGHPDAPIRGISEFPRENIPPLWMTFVSFHNMVVLGLFFQLAMFIGVVKLYRGTIYTSRKFLTMLIWVVPLPLAAIQLGWMAAEVGRQPWIVYGVMRTKDAFSPTRAAGEVLFSIILFSLIYLMLGALYLFLLIKKVKHGPDADAPGDVDGDERPSESRFAAAGTAALQGAPS